MKNKKQHIPDFDDLIFESRNREYGAYQLRKKYKSFVITGIVISIFLGCAVVIIPFMANRRTDIMMAGGGRFVQVQMDALKPPPEEFYVPAAPAPPPPEEANKIQEVIKYVAPEVVDTVLTTDLKPIATDELLAHTDNPIPEITGSYGYGDDILGGEGGYGTDEPFFIVEVMPSFRGGDLNTFRSYIQRITNYPQEAIDKKIQGRVYLTFIVEANGSVTNVNVVKGVDPLIDNEALKAIRSSPDWSPGLQRGQPVRVRYSMWVSFVI